MTPEMGEPKREEYSQERLIGESPDTTLEIATEGRVIRPALAIPDALAHECRVHADPDGVQIRLVDPSNVGMAMLQLHPEAFDHYDAPEAFVTGVDLETLKSQLRGARKGVSTSDPVRLDLDTVRTRIQIERDYQLAKLHRTDGFLNIDPDSMRQERDPPDLEYTCQATLDAQAFRDAIVHLDEVGDHFALKQSGGDLELGVSVSDSDSVQRAGRVSFPGIVEAVGDDVPEDPESLFSMDYLLDISKALKGALVDDVTLQFGDQIPVRIEFERTDDEDTTLYEGAFMIAPRIQK